MAQLDALKLSEAIRDRLVDFSADDNYVRDERVTSVCRSLWSGPAERGGLISRLWVEATPPSLTGEAGLFGLAGFDQTLAGHLDRRRVVPGHRPLYTHQLEAVRTAASARDGRTPAVVVTAGTGAGKTESFLLPLLNDLFGRPRPHGQGVRALILYPMNALVNDQVERLFEWLREQDRLTFFHFTSETPEDGPIADRKGYPKWDDRSRMRTRREARGLEDHTGRRIAPSAARGPQPDILVTNYSMLEYMLCRPQDAVFFGPALRAIILDEAHLYTGTLAAEITLLLRRVLERCGLASERVLQIATSATIGSGDKDELADFAATLFTKPRDLVRVIVGEKAPFILPPPCPPDREPTAEDVASAGWPSGPTLTVETDGRTVLARDEALCSTLAERLPMLVGRPVVEKASADAAGRPAVLLHAALGYAPLLHRAADALAAAGRLPLDGLAEALWGAASPAALEATVVLLRMGASARQEAGDYPLLPHRLHLLARPTDGLVACLDPDCCGEAARKLEGLGIVSPGHHDHCPDCGGATLTLHHCANCGTWGLAADSQGLRLAPVLPRGGNRTLRYFATTAHEGTRLIRLDARSGQRKGSGRTHLWEAQQDCPVCSSPLQDSWKPFASGAPLTLSILAETALSGLPGFPGAARDWLPARGRRMLAFSDSRQEAARLGPRLTLQHEIQLVRAALARLLAAKPEVDDAVAEEIRREIAQLEGDLRVPDLGGALRARKQRRLEELRLELVEAMRGGSIASWVEDLRREDLPARRILAELLAPGESAKHHAGGYTQRSWEENRRAVLGDLLGRIGRELSSPVRGAITLETIGLAEVTYPGLDGLEADPDLLSLLPAIARDPLRGAWGDFLAALCNSIRSEGAISLGKDELDAMYQFGRALIGRWCAECVDDGRDLIRLIGATPSQRRRRFADAVLRRLGVESDRERLAAELLRGGFRQLATAAREARLTWLQADQRATFAGPAVDAVRLIFPRLSLRRPRQIFRCGRTGHLWPRSVLGCAPEVGCESLTRLEGDWEAELDRASRVGRPRTEYKASRVFETALWAEEHSAQLAPEENRRLQDLFRAGIRNVLSSTTTLELGIDIGGLSAVLMSNVPPGKANYLQRAGRAGRRADGSSIVITFARPRPYDREVFQKFGDYLDRPLRRPRIFLERKRVVRRHGHAFLLGEFFRQVYPREAHVGAMNAFGHVGSFCRVRPPRYWPKGEDKPDLPLFAPDWSDPAGVGWWHERPDQGLEGHFTDYLNWVRDYGDGSVRPALERLFRGSSVLSLLGDWGQFIDLILEDFDRALRTWRQEFDELKASWLAIGGGEARDRALANMLRYQLVALCEMTVIEALADRQFLPRYGFPIGVQRLRVIQPDEQRAGRIREEDQYRLERGGLLALREYVPGSQLLVGGRLVTSRGLLKHWTGANLDSALGLQGKLGRCEQGHEFYHIATGPHDTVACPICGDGPAQAPEDLLLPRHGFTSAAWDPPKLSSDAAVVAEVERTTFAFAQPARPGFSEESEDHFGDVPGLVGRYREDGELLVYNRGEHRRGFAICTKCGYAESEPSEDSRTTRGRDQLPSSFVNHAPLTSTHRGARCWAPGEAVNPLRHRVLAARETTDVLLLDLSACLAERQDIEPLAETLARALHIAGARLLELDTRELGSMVVLLSQGNGRGIVVYDNVPGGAGHVHELFKFGRSWLEAALGAMYGYPEHHRRCETACLDCLLTFDAQEAMQRGLLQRRSAYQALFSLLGRAGSPVETGSTA